MVIGSGLPAASAFWRNTHFDMAAGGKKHRQLIPAPDAQAVDGDVGQRGVVGIAGQRQAQAEEGAGVDRVLVGAGSRVRKSKSGSSARKICSWQGALLAGTTTGATGFFTALPTSRASCEASQPSSSAGPLAAGVHTPPECASVDNP